MKIKNLVTLGDSWVYGDELGDDDYRQQHCWPQLVASRFNLTLQNLGFNGESLQSAIWSALWWLENQYKEDSLIILGLTDPWRTSWFRASHAQDTNPWSSHVNIESIFDETNYHLMKKIYIDMCDCEALRKFNRQQAIIFFEGLSKNTNIPVLQFDLYISRQRVFGVNHMYAGESAAQWVGDHINPQGHPDETGHILIAKKLISYIESAKLA
jgi:hypothetical protein